MACSNNQQEGDPVHYRVQNSIAVFDWTADILCCVSSIWVTTACTAAAGDVHILVSPAAAANAADICSFTQRDELLAFCLKIKCPTRL